jgi:hypothetical protein
MTTPKKQYTLKSLDYNVSIFKDGKAKKQQVSGFAVDFGLPVKICIRHECDAWYADEFETGFSIRERGFPSRDLHEVLPEIEEILMQKLVDGYYEKQIAKAKELLIERGLLGE